MVGQDRARQERLLNLAGWLYYKHRSATLAPGTPFRKFRFERADLDTVPTLSVYGLGAGDAGEKALERDVKELQSFGIVVEWDPTSRQWVSHAVPLSDEECRALATAALAVLVDDGSTRPDGYHVPGAGLSTEGAELIVAYAPITDLLVEAIRTRTPVEIEHRGTTRTVDPWHVSMADGRWYLIGRDHLRDEQRTFAIDTIASATTSGNEASYTIPVHDFEKTIRGAIDPDQWTDAEPVDVTLRVHPALVGRARSLLRAEEAPSSDMGWVTMSCTVRSFEAFVFRLLGLRARAFVTGPNAVRDRVVAGLEELR